MRACGGLWSSRHTHALAAPRRALSSCCLTRPRSSSNVAMRAAAAAASSPETAATTRFAVVGDVHGKWCNAADGAALAALSADFALFVGDIGNEDADLVREIAALGHPKAVILGNHDAWHSLTARSYAGESAKRARVTAAPADELRAASLFSRANGGSDGDSSSSSGGDGGSGQAVPPPAGPRSLVQQQLDALGTQHVGYSWVPVPSSSTRHNGNASNGNGSSAAGDNSAGIAVVGGRPFSKGGPGWSSIAAFMRAAYGVDSPDDSAARIVAAAEAAAAAAGAASDNGSGSGGQSGQNGQSRRRAVVLLAHNGPAGLGGARHDVCGVDFRRDEGDHGDLDLRAALDALAAKGAPAAAVVFGHMHHTLRGGGLRRMARLDAATGTAYLNAATVPRVRAGSAPGETLRHFLVFEMRGGRVEYAADVWVRVSAQQQQQKQDGGGEEGGSVEVGIASETAVLRTEVRGGGGGSADGSSSEPEQQRVRFVWDAHLSRWQREGEDEPAPAEAAASRVAVAQAAVAAAAATATGKGSGSAKPRARRRR